VLAAFGDQLRDIYPEAKFMTVIDAPAASPQVYISLCLGQEPERHRLVRASTKEFASL
jgi:hypothetical protein